MKSWLLSLWMFLVLALGNERGEIGDGDPPGGDGGDGGNKEGDPPGGDGPSGGNGDGDPPGGDNGQGSQGNAADISKFSPEAQKMIKDLRAENAKSRTSNNKLSARLDKFEEGFKAMFGDESDKMTPEQKLEHANAVSDQTQYENTVLTMAIQNGVQGEQLDYFRFLVDSAVNELKEGEEMTDDQLAKIVAKAKGVGGSAPAGGGDGGSGNDSSVDGDTTGGNPPNPEGDGNVTLDAFVKMSITEKSALYRKNQPLYTQLMAQAKDKNLIRA